MTAQRYISRKITVNGHASSSFQIGNFHRLFLKNQTLRIKKMNLRMLFYLFYVWCFGTGCMYGFTHFFVDNLDIEAMEWIALPQPSSETTAAFIKN